MNWVVTCSRQGKTYRYICHGTDAAGNTTHAEGTAEEVAKLGVPEGALDVAFERLMGFPETVLSQGQLLHLDRGRISGNLSQKAYVGRDKGAATWLTARQAWRMQSCRPQATSQPKARAAA